MKTNAENFKSRLLNVEFKEFPENPRYMVSKTGMILDSETGELLQPHLTGGNGKDRRYERVILKKDNYYKFTYIHRMVAKTWIGDRSNEGLIVHHVDGGTLNNHVSNLEWVTQSENILYANRTSKSSKLSPQTVAKIRILSEAGWKNARIADALKINHMVVYRCVKGITFVGPRYDQALEEFKDDSVKMF